MPVRSSIYGGICGVNKRSYGHTAHTVYPAYLIERSVIEPSRTIGVQLGSVIVFKNINTDKKRRNGKETASMLQVYILRKFCTLNRPPNPPESVVSDLIGRLPHPHK